MNAPSPALVAPRPERLRLVGQRRQILAVMHQRLMFGMLVYAGVVALIALRILWLAAFGDHAGRKEGLLALIPERGDIVDRDGQPLARTIDAWTIAIHPTKVIGDKLALARQLAQLMPEHSEAQYFALGQAGSMRTHAPSFRRCTRDESRQVRALLGRGPVWPLSKTFWSNDRLTAPPWSSFQTNMTSRRRVKSQNFSTRSCRRTTFWSPTSRRLPSSTRRCFR